MKRIGVVRALFLAAAGLSFLFSVWLWFSGSKDQGLFVGLWVPSILAFGIFATASWAKEARGE